MIHPRVGLHQVAFLDRSTPEFLEHCRAIGVPNVTLVTPLLMRPGVPAQTRRSLDAGGLAVESVNHQLTGAENLETGAGAATDTLLEALDIAADLGARSLYLQTGGRGAMTWEQAAERFATLVAPALSRAADSGVALLVENASSFNADIHIAHTLADTIKLAEIAGIGLCVDWHACWVESGLKTLIRQAIPITGLVQVSDYVLGDRIAPCRAVPGDGVIPLESLMGDVLDAGYRGVFDIELVGPRISAEGAPAASARAAERISGLLTRLGA